MSRLVEIYGISNIVEKNCWFTDRNIGGLYRLDIGTKDIEQIISAIYMQDLNMDAPMAIFFSLPEIIIHSYAPLRNVLTVLVINIEEKSVIKKEYPVDTNIIAKSIYKDNKIYLLPGALNSSLYILHLRDNKTEKMSCNELFNQHIGYDYHSFEYCESNGFFYGLYREGGLVAKINIDDIHLSELIKPGNGIKNGCLTWGRDNGWIISEDDNSIYCIDTKGNEIKRMKHPYEKEAFGRILAHDRWLICLPRKDGSVCVYNEINENWKEYDYKYTANVSRINDMPFWDYSIDSNIVYLFPINGVMLEIDLENEVSKAADIYYSYDEDAYDREFYYKRAGDINRIGYIKEEKPKDLMYFIKGL